MAKISVCEVKCSSCGAPVPAPGTNWVTFSELKNGEILINVQGGGEHSVECSYCGSTLTFEDGEALVRSGNDFVFSTGGSAFIAGNITVTDGDFVGGDKINVGDIRNSTVSIGTRRTRRW